MFTATTAAQNTAIGLNALLYTTSGGSNVAVGLDGLMHNTTGSSNTAIGYNAGTHITGGATPNTTASNSVFIGRDSKAAADGQTNQIVIGQNAVGNGSNTATFGNTATTGNYFTGSINGGSFVKSGGTSAQFLKADGSVDSSTYQAALTLTTTGTSGAATLVGATLNIPQYAAGITGSGVANQLTYWNGTSSVTGSTGLTYVDSTGLIELNKSQNNPTAINITNGTSGTNARAAISLISNTGNGQFTIQKYSTLHTAYKINNPTDAILYNGTAGDISILNDFATGKIKFGAGGSSTAQMTLTSAGRLLLGTTTESTFIFDAVGTARITGNTKIGNTIYSDPSSNLIVGIDGSAARATIANNNNYQDLIFVNTTISSGNINSWGFGQRRDTYFGNTLGSFQFIGSYTDNSGTGNMVGGGFRVPIICNPNGDIILSGASNSINGNVSIGSTTIASSALLSVTSTTKGFLPPRMTTTEKNAISSPAAGLVVYDSTQNSLNTYDGATWRSDEDTITTNRQTASYSLVLADRGKLVEMNSASANTLTIPLNSSIAFPIGSKIDVTQYGAGATTITATSGVTIRSFTSFLKIAGQYAACTLVKIGTDEWYCYGNLIA
jgi:hypothetical protein